MFQAGQNLVLPIRVFEELGVHVEVVPSQRFVPGVSSLGISFVTLDLLEAFQVFQSLEISLTYLLSNEKLEQSNEWKSGSKNEGCGRVFKDMT